ncbi:UNVERIFIED_CONTAM: hypothetical protein PYX00_009248 [Menopon gallinae]|uniref:Multiple coagulation factor deficiency protein 2 n=1 Tax=Menopon gallinae TaxID=328185 RepID=A0AAW2HAT3_9NEOP
MFVQLKITESCLLLAFFAASVAGYGPHHPRGAHAHYKPQAGSNPMKDARFIQDEVHIKEDLSNIIPNTDTQRMSPAELEFHYFKIHDYDNNTKLDGLEILQAIRHTLHEEDGETAGKEMQHFIDLIDRVLEEDDLDRDGYLSYVEYVIGREREKKG